MGFNNVGPIKDKASYQKFYDANSHFSNRNICRETGRVHWLLPYVNVAMPVLEVGCQHGGVTKILYSMIDSYSDLIALDITDEHLKQTKELFNKYGDASPTILKCYIEDFVSHTKFWTIVMFEVLEHVLDDKAVLSKCKELLASDGNLLISVPFENDAPEPDHLRTYTPESLNSLLYQYFNNVRIAISYNHWDTVTTFGRRSILARVSDYVD